MLRPSGVGPDQLLSSTTVSVAITPHRLAVHWVARALINP